MSTPHLDRGPGRPALTWTFSVPEFIFVEGPSSMTSGFWQLPTAFWCKFALIVSSKWEPQLVKKSGQFIQIILFPITMPVGFSLRSYPLALCLKSTLCDWKIWHNILSELHFHPGLSTLEERLRVGRMLTKWTAQCPRSSSILTITTPGSIMTSPSWNSTAPSLSPTTPGPSA